MNYYINFKTPVIIKNALPFNLKIRTDIITGKLPKNTTPGQSSSDENFSYD